MAYNQESFVNDYSISLEDVKETLVALSLDPEQDNFTKKERERFAEARQVLKDGAVSSMNDLKSYFDQKQSPADQAATSPSSSNNGAGHNGRAAGLTPEEMAELLASATEEGYDLGLTKAEIIAQVSAKVANQRLRELIKEGAFELGISRQLREWRSGKSIIDIDAIVEERWTQHQLEQYPNPQSLPPSSMPSSENE